MQRMSSEWKPTLTKQTSYPAIICHCGATRLIRTPKLKASRDVAHSYRTIRTSLFAEIDSSCIPKFLAALTAFELNAVVPLEEQTAISISSSAIGRENLVRGPIPTRGVEKRVPQQPWATPRSGLMEYLGGTRAFSGKKWQSFKLR
jgi:hypothetical protein